MKRDNFTRKDISKAIHKTMGFSQSSASDIVDEFFLSIKQALLSEDKVKLVRFGTFNVIKKESRIGRNPQTGQAMEISKRSMVSFKPSKELREKINR